MCRGSHMGTMAAMFVFQRESVWPQLTHRPSQLESQTFKSKSCDLMTQSPVRVTSRGSQAAAAAAKTGKKNGQMFAIMICVHHIEFLRLSRSTLYEMRKQLRSRFASYMVTYYRLPTSNGVASLPALASWHRATTHSQQTSVLSISDLDRIKETSSPYLLVDTLLTRIVAFLDCVRQFRKNHKNMPWFHKKCPIFSKMAKLRLNWGLNKHILSILCDSTFDILHDSLGTTMVSHGLQSLERSASASLPCRYSTAIYCKFAQCCFWMFFWVSMQSAEVNI